jgi:hypothetical protein
MAVAENKGKKSQENKADSQPVVIAQPLIQRTDPAQVFIFLSPIETAEATTNEVLALGTVLRQLAESRLNQLESVRLRTYREMPSVPAVMARYGDLEKRDRVSLIEIKNATGFDGMIKTQYRLDNKGVELTMTYIDFRNGQIFRKRQINQAIDAAMFLTIERDMIEFATALRRGYRVTLHVSSTPVQARVYLNGSFAGNTPLVRELLTGDYHVELKAQGYQTYSTKQFFKSGDSIHLRAVLHTALVRYQITSEPPNSRVFMGRQLLGTTPLMGQFPPGEYDITVTHEGYKDYRTKMQLKPGDRLNLHTPLYNPLAARFLNAKPGFRLDSRQFHFAYRYVYLGIDRPYMLDTHFIDISFLLRMHWFEVGLRFSPGIRFETSNKINSFLGEAQGLQKYDIHLIQLAAVFKYALWEKYSFASIYLGTAMGATLNRIFEKEKDETLTTWSFTGELYASVVSRLFRRRNFSMELQFDLGFTYLGQLTYTERKFNLFGQAIEEQLQRPMLGPFGRFSLRMIFWNNIF